MIITDYYDICEEAVVTLLRDTAAFAWKKPLFQVTKSDDTYLDQGYDHFAITYPGAFPDLFMATDSHTVQWEILIDLLVRWNSSEAAAWIAFKAFRSKVFNLFNISYEGQTLNRTPGISKRVKLTTGERPRYIPLNGDPNTDKVSHIAQVTILTVQQTINIEE